MQASRLSEYDNSVGVRVSGSAGEGIDTIQKEHVKMDIDGYRIDVSHPDASGHLKTSHIHIYCSKEGSDFTACKDIKFDHDFYLFMKSPDGCGKNEVIRSHP